MKIKFNASKVYLLLIVFTFFGCKDQLFDSPVSQSDSTVTPSTPSTPEAEAPAPLQWYNDTTTAKMPVSNGQPLNSSYKKGNKTATIVILGSSTAEGKGASNIKYSWVELLKAQLKKDNKIVNVINLGKGGYTTYHIMANGNKVANRPGPDVARNITKALSYKPFLVIVNMPTNDIEKKYTDTEILGNFTKLRKAFEAAKVNFVVTGTQPRNFTEASQRQRLKTLNKRLVDGSPVRVADVLNKLSDENYFIKKHYAFSDGIHVNDKGHQVINAYIFNTTLFKQVMGYKSVNP